MHRFVTARGLLVPNQTIRAVSVEWVVEAKLHVGQLGVGSVVVYDGEGADHLSREHEADCEAGDGAQQMPNE